MRYFTGGRLARHTFEATNADDRFQTTRNIVGAEKLLTPLMFSQNYHLVHHLHPIVPFYRYLQAWRNEEVAYLGCRDEFLNALAQPQLATSQAGDYQLALDPAASIGQVSGISSGQAHAFNHVAGNYAGFIHAGARPNGIASPEQMRDHVLARLRTAFPSATIASSGRRTLTHDGNNALVGARVVIGRPGTPSADRDAALSVLAGGTPAHTAQGTFNPTLGDLAIVFTVIERPNNQVIVTAAAVSIDVATGDG